MSLAQTSELKTADTLFINANIYPGIEATADPAKVQPRPRAIAIAGERILGVGSEQEMQRFKGDKTKVIDLGGQFVMPGFNDAHLHLASGGFEKLNLDLAGTMSLADMLARIKNWLAQGAAAGHPLAPGDWVVGRGWDHTVWPEQKLPTRQDLDTVTTYDGVQYPAKFTRVDGHICVVNSAALRVAGITGATKAPAGGKIDLDRNGEPTGILRESAQELVDAKIPAPTPATRKRAIELALQDAAQNGITSAQDNSDWEDFLVYEELEREGRLTLRITEWLPFGQPVTYLQDHRAHHPQTDTMLHTGLLKGFMDGSLGSRTAAMLAPYADDPRNTGLPQFTQSKLNDLADQRVAANFQMGFHAIGDAATRMALDAFAEAERYARENNASGGAPAQDFRFRVEHAQVVAPDDFKRFRELKVIASMQPNHLLTDMHWAVARLGAQRARHSYAWREFLDNGVKLAFGTDYPVEPITPFRGLYAAVTRKDETGTSEYFPEQKITIAQAIAAYTTGAAYAEFAEKDKGLLAPGMLADFVVLDRDLTRVAPPEILHTKVLRTVIGGRTVFEATGQR